MYQQRIVTCPLWKSFKRIVTCQHIWKYVKHIDTCPLWTCTATCPFWKCIKRIVTCPLWKCIKRIVTCPLWKCIKRIHVHFGNLSNVQLHVHFGNVSNTDNTHDFIAKCQYNCTTNSYMFTLEMYQTQTIHTTLLPSANTTAPRIVTCSLWKCIKHRQYTRLYCQVPIQLHHE